LYFSVKAHLLGLSITEEEHYNSIERKISPAMMEQLVKSDGVDHGASMVASAIWCRERVVP
jgi:hypothetical protein